MLTLEQKIELANWIIDHNNNVALTGSLSIYLRCKKLNIPYPLDREPQDIDILVDTEAINKDDDFPACFCLPPFLEDEKMNNNFDYPIIGRFYYRGTKVEFLYADNYRDEFVEMRELCIPKNGRGYYKTDHWNFGLLFDLIGAKQYFMKADSNPEYLNKTHNDIDKLFNMIIDHNYDWEKEYINILSFYINRKLSLKNFKDYGRITIEGWIWDNIVKGYPELVKWFNLVSHIDYDWFKDHKDKFDYFDEAKLHPMDDFCRRILWDDDIKIIKDIVKNRITEFN